MAKLEAAIAARQREEEEERLKREQRKERAARSQQKEKVSEVSLRWRFPATTCGFMLVMF